MSSTESHPYAGLETPDTSNATWFNPNQKSIDEYWRENEYWGSPSAFRYQKKSKMWSYLSQLNDGIRNGKRTNGDYFTYLSNRDLIENVALQLDLPRHYWGKARRYYDALHHKIIDGVRKDSTAVAVVMYVINTFQPARPFDPNTKQDDGRTVAEMISGRFNIPIKTIHKRYGQVRYRIERTDLDFDPATFDKRNMGRRNVFDDGTGDYTGICFNDLNLENEGGI